MGIRNLAQFFRKITEKPDQTKMKLMTVLQ